MTAPFWRWIAAPSIPALGLHLLAKAFQFNVRYMLRIAVYVQERKFPYCRSGTLDTFGDLAVACHRKGVRFQGTIKFAIIKLPPVQQLTCLSNWKQPSHCEKNSGLGDIYLPSWKSGQSAALDITVTSSLCNWSCWRSKICSVWN